MAAMRENLSCLTKDELTDIMMRLGMPRIRRSAKKAEMIAHIDAHMDDCWEALLLQLRLEEIDALRAHLSRGEITEADLAGEDGEAFRNGQLTLWYNGLWGLECSGSTGADSLAAG